MQIMEALKLETKDWLKKPSLAVVSVGEKSENSVYVSQKRKFAKELNFGFRHYHFAQDVAASEFRLELNKICKSDLNTAIVIQLPLPEKINASVLNIIPPEKDADVLSDKTVGAFLNNRWVVEPPTAAGIMKILESGNISIKGKFVVIFGYGRLVGRFLAPMIVWRGGIPVIVEKDTPQAMVLELAGKADIIISAVGSPRLVTPEMVKVGVVVIDSGFSVVDQKLVGDVEFDLVKNKASFITPVPGGVGPVGVAMLFSNIVSLYKKQK